MTFSEILRWNSLFDNIAKINVKFFIFFSYLEIQVPKQIEKWIIMLQHVAFSS